jgi:hypothetical protein
MIFNITLGYPPIEQSLLLQVLLSGGPSVLFLLYISRRSLLSRIRRIRRRWYISKIEKFRSRHTSHPASLKACMRLQKYAANVLKNPNCLTRPESSYFRTGETIHDSQVAEVLRREEATPWRLADDTINWLIDFLRHKQPRVVLEFGSGLSTACLCIALTRIHGSNGFRLLSVEQDTGELERTMGRMRELDGFYSCRVIHAPLVRTQVAERPTFIYDLEKSRDDLAWLGKAEFILIDGPYAPGPCREGTLSQVRPHVQPGASFMMDDALREKELLTGALWAQSGISVEGILTLGEGVMIGTVP